MFFSPDLREPTYVFAGLRLKADGTLLRGDQEVHLPPKGLAALRVLLAHAGRIVPPHQLRRALWGEVNVTADSVPRCVSSLRAALLPDDCIQTLYKQGYRFTAPVRVEQPDSPAARVPRLAVLPFQASIGVADHLGAAVAEETITRLSRGFNGRRPLFTLVARDSVFTMAQQGHSARQVGEALDADLVLTGSLRAMTTHYRLRVEMVRVHDDAQIWVEDFLVPQTRTAGLESQLAGRLANRLDAGLEGLSLSAAEEPRESEHNSARHQAYEHFQLGHQEMRGLHNFDIHNFDIQDGLHNMVRATELDPALLPAHLDLINLCVTHAFYGFLSPAAASEQARRAARAIPCDYDGAAAVLPALGWMKFHVDRNLEGALRAFENSAHLPHDFGITRCRAAFALSRHRFDEAIGLLESALRDDPFSALLHARLGWAWHLARDPEKSLRHIDYAITHFPSHEGVALYGATILAYNGRAERALELAEHVQRCLPTCDIATAARAYALARAGRADDAAACLEHLHGLNSERYVSSTFISAVSLELGDPETAIAALRSAGEARCPWFFQVLADPRLDSLRAHPEFVRMIDTLAAMETTAEQHARSIALPIDPDKIFEVRGERDPA
ncbi:MAG TPA: winged helix-turn-helix domain-containing protein [Terracidiphilus sp.]|nr:winged helix-turn-helix domain-containing protein [Terracidiphilus sp.]